MKNKNPFTGVAPVEDPPEFIYLVFIFKEYGIRRGARSRMVQVPYRYVDSLRSTYHTVPVTGTAGSDDGKIASGLVRGSGS